MSKKSFIASSSGLKNIIFTTTSEETNSNVDDFHFYIGDIEIKMNRILADFISPRVSHIHQTDPTIESIKLLPNKF